MTFLWHSTLPLVVYVMGTLLTIAWQSRNGEHLETYRLIRPTVVLQSLMVLVVVAAAIAGLLALHNPILSFSWYSAIVQRTADPSAPGGDGADPLAGGPGSLLLGPLSYPALIAPFVVLLLFLLPRLANTEERIFR